MRKTARENEEVAGIDEIEVSAETAVIADALYAGLSEIAGAINGVARAIEFHARMTAEGEEPEAKGSYLDGSSREY